MESLRRPIIRREYTEILARRNLGGNAAEVYIPFPLTARHEPSDGRKIDDAG